METSTARAFEHRCAELQDRLTDACARLCVKDAWVGAASAGRRHHAFAGQTGSMISFEVPTGCLAKVMTATLMWHLIQAGMLGSDEEVLECLAGSVPPEASVLRGVRIEHLLDHTHGLDGSLIGSAPLAHTGRIDTTELLRQLSVAGPLCEPGGLYNYCSVGALLAAAVLERIHRKVYKEILDESLLRPLGVKLRLSNVPASSGAPRAMAVCPASGGHMLSAHDDILALLQYHLGWSSPSTHARPQPPCRGMLERSARLPGWSPLEKGVTRGWKDYGAGWLGQNANFPDCTVLARLHVERGLAVAVATRGMNAEAAFPLLQHLFADVVPELVAVDVPDMLRPEEWAGIDPGRYTGVYRNAAQELSVQESEGRLELNVRSTARDRLLFEGSRRLYPAANDIFFPEPADPALFPFVQFVSRRAGDTRRYVWNGRNVWRSVAG